MGVCLGCIKDSCNLQQKEEDQKDKESQHVFYVRVNRLLHDSPPAEDIPHHPAVFLTGYQLHQIWAFIDDLTDDDLQLYYQYYPPGLPPGPDSIDIKRIKNTRNCAGPDKLVTVIQDLRYIRFNNLVKSLQNLGDYNNGTNSLSFADAETLAGEIFTAWDDSYPTYSCTRDGRALASFRAVSSATQGFTFPEGTSIWTLVEVLHPGDEDKPIVSLHDETVPLDAELDMVVAIRKLFLAGVHTRRQHFITDQSPSEEELMAFDGAIIAEIYQNSLDISRVASKITKRGIGVNYTYLWRDDTQAAIGGDNDDNCRHNIHPDPPEDHPDIPAEDNVEYNARRHHRRVMIEQVRRRFSNIEIDARGGAAARFTILSGQNESTLIQYRISNQYPRPKRWKRRFCSKNSKENDDEQDSKSPSPKDGSTD